MVPGASFHLGEKFNIIFMKLTEEEVRQKLKNFVREINDDFALAKVLEIAENSCKVSLVGNEEVILENVLFAPNDENDKGFLLVPKVASVVLVNKEENILAMCSELEIAWIKFANDVFLKMENDALQIKYQNTILKIDSSGITLQKQVETLNKILVDLVQATASMTFTNSAGTTSVANNATTITNILPRINDLLK
jgi:hypothetical protein